MDAGGVALLHCAVGFESNFGAASSMSAQAAPSPNPDAGYHRQETLCPCPQQITFLPYS